jgi:hypothetical protein
MSVRVTVKPTHTGIHPLEGEVAERAEIVAPLGAILVDAALPDGSTNLVLPNFQKINFSAINSGTGATIVGGNLVPTVTGEAVVNFNQSVQVTPVTGPLYNVYFMWVVSGIQRYIGKVILPNDGNGWIINTAGLVSVSVGETLAVYIGTDVPGGTLYYWNQDFQLTVPDTIFPAFSPMFAAPPFVAGQPQANPPIQSAPAPPSTAGFPIIRYGSGSATAPTIASLFPSFTTTFPSPTFVVSNVWTVPTFAGGVWTSTLPARTATTTCVPIGGWGLPGPSGSGPGPPSYPNPPGAGKPFMVMGEDVSVPPAMNENASSEGVSATAEIPRRRRRASA